MLTGISGVLDLRLLKIVSALPFPAVLLGKGLTLLIGLCLLASAYLQIKAPLDGNRTPADLKAGDGIILGIAQGFAALPGMSRSGLTVRALLLPRFDRAQALRLSFLMSLPIILLGNLILNFNVFQFSLPALSGFGCSFLFGLATIHWLLNIVHRIKFGYCVLGFALLTISAVFI